MLKIFLKNKREKEKKIKVVRLKFAIVCEKAFGDTVGAQSIAPVRQNLVNCRRNISAHRTCRELRFFLFGRTWAGK